MKKIVCSLGVLGWMSLCGSSSLLAVDESRILSRYKLVGVISDDLKGGETRGIVVIKDAYTQRTLTLRSGDRLPDDDGVRIESVSRRQVILNDQGGRVALTFGNSQVEDHDEVKGKIFSDKSGRRGRQKDSVEGSNGDLVTPEDLETFLSDMVPFSEGNGQEENLESETVEPREADRDDIRPDRIFSPGRANGLREKGEVIWPPSPKDEKTTDESCEGEDCETEPRAVPPDMRKRGDQQQPEMEMNNEDAAQLPSPTKGEVRAGTKAPPNPINPAKGAIDPKAKKVASVPTPSGEPVNDSGPQEDETSKIEDNNAHPEARIPDDSSVRENDTVARADGDVLEVFLY